MLPYFPSVWLVQRAQQPLVWRLGGCAALHPRHTKSRGRGEALPAQGAGPPCCAPDWSVPLAPGLSGEEVSMGTGRLHLAVLPGLILLSLSLAEQCSGLAGWVFTEPQLRASTGDSVLLQCLFLDPVAKGWMMTKVDWLRVAGAGMQKVGQDQGMGGGALCGGRWQGRVSEAALLLSGACGGACGEACLPGPGYERRKVPRCGGGAPPLLPMALHHRGTTALGAVSWGFLREHGS